MLLVVSLGWDNTFAVLEVLFKTPSSIFFGHGVFVNRIQGELKFTKSYSNIDSFGTRRDWHILEVFIPMF